MGEGTGCTAMDQVFHVDCFVCMTCSTKLRGKPFFAVEKKAYCEPCYIVSNPFSPSNPPASLPSFGSLWLFECPCFKSAHYDIRGEHQRVICRECSFILTSDNHISFHQRPASCHLSPHTSSFPLFLWLCLVFCHSKKLA